MNISALQARLYELEVIASQHGTMTGDTTEQQYEDICDEIETIEQALNL